jgi:SAM-dependent methyltransferase
VYTDRERAESFGGVAEQYDRFRLSYPDRLIDELAALGSGAVLDVGCGTGKAARLLAERGLNVLGIEIDPKMAAVARRHGIDVEVASFEAWEARGRSFDLITCAQAWHWVDPAVGAPKAAALLQPGGTLALFWNHDELELSLRRALDAAYRQFAPELLGSGGDDAAERADQRHRRLLEQYGPFSSVEVRRYRWQRSFTREEWTGLIGTYSDHVRLGPDREAALLAGVGAVIDALGGSMDVSYRTSAILARVAA